MRITLIGKPDCHLCQDAAEVLDRVCGELGLTWEKVSILEDPALYDEFWEKIPVVQVEGRTVATMAALPMRRGARWISGPSMRTAFVEYYPIIGRSRPLNFVPSCTSL